MARLHKTSGGDQVCGPLLVWWEQREFRGARQRGLPGVHLAPGHREASAAPRGALGDCQLGLMVTSQPFAARQVPT